MTIYNRSLNCLRALSLQLEQEGSVNACNIVILTWSIRSSEIDNWVDLLCVWPASSYDFPVVWSESVNLLLRLTICSVCTSVCTVLRACCELSGVEDVRRVWMFADLRCSEALSVWCVYKACYCSRLCAWRLITVPCLFWCDRHRRRCRNHLLVSWHLLISVSVPPASLLSSVPQFRV